MNILKFREHSDQEIARQLLIVDNHHAQLARVPKLRTVHPCPKSLGNGSSKVVLSACPEFAGQLAHKDLFLMWPVGSRLPLKGELGPEQGLILLTVVQQSVRKTTVNMF